MFFVYWLTVYSSDPVVVLVLAISFVFSVVVLHVGSKMARVFLK